MIPPFATMREVSCALRTAGFWMFQLECSERLQFPRACSRKCHATSELRGIHQEAFESTIPNPLISDPALIEAANESLPLIDSCDSIRDNNCMRFPSANFAIWSPRGNRIIFGPPVSMFPAKYLRRHDASRRLNAAQTGTIPGCVFCKAGKINVRFDF